MNKELCNTVDELAETVYADGNSPGSLVHEIVYGVLASIAWYEDIKATEVAVNAKLRELGTGVRVFLTTIK